MFEKYFWCFHFVFFISFSFMKEFRPHFCLTGASNIHFKPFYWRMAYKVDRHLGSDQSPAIFHQENEPERDVCNHLWPFYASLFKFFGGFGSVWAHSVSPCGYFVFILITCCSWATHPHPCFLLSRSFRCNNSYTVQSRTCNTVTWGCHFTVGSIHSGPGLKNLWLHCTFTVE